MSDGDGTEEIRMRPGRSPKSRVSRRRFLIGSGVGLAAAGGIGIEGLLLEPNRLSISSHVLGTRQRDATPIRLAVVTDLHLESISELHQRIASAIRTAEPSIIVLVGDCIDSAGSLPLLSEFLRLLPGAGRRVATLGNWEHWSRVDLSALRRAYESEETELLVNEGMQVADGAFIFGTDDALAGSPNLERLPNAPDHETIVLSHSPVFRDSPAATDPRIRAVISGHTHGGQVAIAGWAPLCPPGSGPYVSGWYRDDGPDLFVSRGIGTSIVPIRLGSTPELALIDWFPHSR